MRRMRQLIGAAGLLSLPFLVTPSVGGQVATSGLVAYVPRGAVERGDALVTAGGGKTVRCEACHGPLLTGLGETSALAGRSPMHAARQLRDFQPGVRNGTYASLMTGVVGQLSDDDIIDISAHLASLGP